MATKNQTKQPRNQAPKAAESQTNDQAAAEQAAKEAAAAQAAAEEAEKVAAEQAAAKANAGKDAEEDAKEEEGESLVAPQWNPRVFVVVFDEEEAPGLEHFGCEEVARVTREGYPVVALHEGDGAYRAMVPALGPMLTGVAAMSVMGAVQGLNEAIPGMLAALKAETGEDMPVRPEPGCVTGALNLMEYLAQPPYQWTPYWGPKQNSVTAEDLADDEQIEAEETARCRTIVDEAAMRVILAARKGGQNERHEERTATRLTVATRTNEGIRLRVVENPDAHMDEILNRQANQGDRPVLHDRLAHIGKRLETIRSEMDARLSSVTGAKKWRDRVVAVLLGEAEPEPGDLEKFEAMDPAVTGPIREHVSEFERLDDEAAQIEEQLARMDKELAAKQRVATVLMDEVIPVDADVAMHLYTV